ncbi:MAG: cyclase family protein [Alphaproteobacteria bacterium]|nr:cyclase family protein [Alphaproteobacteria bacterium]
MTKSPRWKRRPEGSNWGEFGPDDQLGRLNLLTPEKVKQGVAEVREGLTFCLSLPLDLPGGNVLNPGRHPPVLRPTRRNGRACFLYAASLDAPDRTDVINDDLAVIHLQYSTQWDSFAHNGQMFDADDDGVAEMVFYNGYRAGREIVWPSNAAGAFDDADPTLTSAARAVGVDTMAAHGIQGRGVMIDLHAHVGDARQRIDYDALMRILERDRVEVERGDMVCLHTGFARLVLEMGGRPDGERLRRSGAVIHGRDPRLLRWITDTGLVALLADNYAVEELPGPDQQGAAAFAPLHEHCLFKLGIPLGELWFLTDLANWLRAHRRNRFLLTAPPLRLPGAVGSPATPVATV